MSFSMRFLRQSQEVLNESNSSQLYSNGRPGASRASAAAQAAAPTGSGVFGFQRRDLGLS
jgi:hypothetical protein